MSSREPFWFCHECHAEMQPLMVPDPHCASCQSTFVEKMENPSDDPRDFQSHGIDTFDPTVFPNELNAILAGLQALRAGQRPDRASEYTPQNTEPSGTGAGLRFEIRTPSGSSTITVGGPNTLNHHSGGPVPTMSEYLGRRAEPGTGHRPEATTLDPMALHQLMSAIPILTGRRDGIPGLRSTNSETYEPTHPGQFGDYIINQEALDHIITTLMENANSTRPVPATETIVSNLPREVLEEGSPILEKDCAICKEQFKLSPEDPDEQVVLSLPCTHIFHEGCIVHWLKTSGTCPVCRHALVPQPNHSPEPTPSGSVPRESAPRNGSPRNGPPPSASRNSNGGSIFGNFFASGQGSGSGSGGSSRSASNSNRSGRRRARSGGTQDPPFPGSWREQVD